MDAAPVVLAHLEGIAYYCGTFGVVKGLQMYTYLGIPVYERGISRETVLAGRYGGESQKYFNTDLGGRFVDQYADDIAHESKVGYTCLSQRVRTQILKDAVL